MFQLLTDRSLRPLVSTQTAEQGHVGKVVCPASDEQRGDVGELDGKIPD